MADEKPQGAVELELPIEWHVSEAVVSRYANNMIVQHTEHEFIISFFEVSPPLILGTPTKEILEKLESIRAQCVARIIVSAERMPKFVEALSANLERSVSKKSEEGA